MRGHVQRVEIRSTGNAKHGRHYSCATGMAGCSGNGTVPFGETTACLADSKVVRPAKSKTRQR